MTKTVPLLTEREIEILQQVATGASNRQIAQRLGISANTVKVHVRNIFEKTGAASRTEATLYAFRAGLVEGVESGVVTAERSWWQRGWVVGGVVLVLMMVALLIGLLVNRGVPPPENLVDLEQLEHDRWQELAPMPTARKGLAVATYDGKIYAIAGETADGVTNVVERYDPATDTWEVLSPKPTAVTDVHAVVIGGKIYVPGGKTARGDTLSVFEVYDLIEGGWETRTSLPTSLSSYGLVSYQGELYIFGGWDGEENSDTVLSYNPSSGEWKRLQSMLDPASSVGATVTSAGILLVGGNNGKQFLSSNILYHANNNEGAESHVELEDIPEGVAGGGIGTIADIVHVMVGLENGESCRFFKYFTYRDEWECHAISDSFTQSHFGMVELENLIYIIGGEEDNNFSSRNLSYIAIYSILIPVLE